MSEDLDAIIKGESEETEEVTEEVAQEAAPEPTEAESEETTGEQASPPEDDVESLKAKLGEVEKQIDAFKATALDERNKRQAMEQKLGSETQEKPDFWTDPDQALHGITQTVDQRISQATTNMSVELMRSLHDDYDEMEMVFVEAAQQNPALAAQMNQSGNPAKFAYEWGKTQKQMTQFSDPEYLQKHEAELKAKHFAEFEAEQKAKFEQEAATRASLPGSLANDRATGGNTQSVGQESLEDVLGR